jgi:hypothetical protein
VVAVGGAEETEVGIGLGFGGELEAQARRPGAIVAMASPVNI